jgi:ectoine hydroxylase-related dioxygenase (phytanoyl-CoA dioxygenase family)
MTYNTTNDKDEIMKTINKYGVAVIPKLLNANEITNMNNGMWNYLELITSNFTIPIDRNNKKSWRSFYDLYPLHSMLVQHWNIGHAQHVWDLRQNPKVASVFANIWNVNNDELVTSFDGCSFHLPPEETNRGYFRNNYWFHTDQSFTRSGFECIQSWITGYDVDEDDATLAFMEKSNNYHSDFQKAFNITEKDDWYKINETEQQFYLDKGCEIKRISCPAGSMVLWDSRTIHCGIESTKGRPYPKIRYVGYLCYMPRKLATKVNLKKKQKAFHELRTTSHYPCSIKLFSKTPRTYGGDVPNITPIPTPILNPLGKLLAGF